MHMNHKLEFNIGDTVYLKTDIEQKQRIITSISLRPNGCVVYCIACVSTDTWHYGIEISKERDIIMATSN